MPNTSEVNKSIPAEEMQATVGTFSLAVHIECELTPEWMDIFREAKTPTFNPWTIVEGNRLQTTLWQFMYAFGPHQEMSGPNLIVNNSFQLFREKTAEEVIQEFGDRFQSAMTNTVNQSSPLLNEVTPDNFGIVGHIDAGRSTETLKKFFPQRSDEKIIQEKVPVKTIIDNSTAENPKKIELIIKIPPKD